MQLDIIKNAKLYLGIAVIVVGVALAGIFKGINYGIDFTGGNLTQVGYEKTISINEVNSNIDEITSTSEKFSSESRKIQISENIDTSTSVLIRTAELTDEEQDALMEQLKKLGEYKIERQEKVGSSIGSELKETAIYSLILGGILIVLYITLRFEFIFAIAAIIALIHDVVISVGGVALLGYEVNTPFIAAILTILGYSINDTLVVFDRIRETLKRNKEKTLAECINISINQVLSRSINTSITTFLAVLAILIFGGDSLETFITTLLIGIVAGTYSSIFVATPVVYFLEKNNKKKLIEKL